MENQNLDIRLAKIEDLLKMQNLLKKDVLNVKETAEYLKLSESHIYKLTSKKRIPHFCPLGKKLFFNRQELDEWLQRNRVEVEEKEDDIESLAAEYMMKNNMFSKH